MAKTSDEKNAAISEDIKAAQERYEKNQADAAHKKNMKKMWLWVIGVVVILALGGLLFWFMSR